MRLCLLEFLGLCGTFGKRRRRAVGLRGFREKREMVSVVSDVDYRGNSVKGGLEGVTMGRQ